MRLAAIGDNCVDFYEKQGWAYPGGNAVNVAVYGRQLGMDAAYLGWIGTDNFGDMMQEKLKEQDVETVRMQRKQGKTAITYIELLDGDRKFGEDFLNVLEGFQLSDGDLQYLAGFDCVHMAVWGQCKNLPLQGYPLHLPPQYRLQQILFHRRLHFHFLPMWR